MAVVCPTWDTVTRDSKAVMATQWRKWGLNSLVDMEILNFLMLPEIMALPDCPQDPLAHRGLFMAILSYTPSGIPEILKDQSLSLLLVLKHSMASKNPTTKALPLKTNPNREPLVPHNTAPICSRIHFENENK